MTLLEIIAKITLCLVLAAALGFIVGWLFSTILRREKEDEKYRELYEDYERKRHDIVQLEEELSLKNSTIEQLETKYENCERERLSAQLDEKDCKKFEKVIEELRAENEMLISQIKEQKLCEDENEMLKSELQILEEEKDKLLSEIENCGEFRENYKNLIMEIEALKSEKEKLLAERTRNDHAEHTQKREEEEETRLFVPEEIGGSEILEKIKEDVLILKEQVRNIKEERDRYKAQLERIRKKLDQKKRALKACKAAAKAMTKEKTQKSDIDHIYDIAGKLESEGKAGIEIKSLTQLIKDTLDDLKK